MLEVKEREDYWTQMMKVAGPRVAGADKTGYPKTELGDLRRQMEERVDRIYLRALHTGPGNHLLGPEELQVHWPALRDGGAGYDVLIKWAQTIDFFMHRPRWTMHDGEKRALTYHEFRYLCELFLGRQIHQIEFDAAVNRAEGAEL